MINDYAFEETTSLTTIRLPASLGRISALAFCNAGLERYEAAEGSAFMVQDGVLFNAAGGGFSVSVANNKIEKEDKTNLLVRFYNGYTYTLLYPESVSYSSSDQSVVTVSPKGEVTGVAEGTAEVTAYLTNEPVICRTVTITVGNSSQATGSGENAGSGTTGSNTSIGGNSTGDDTNTMKKSNKATVTVTVAKAFQSFKNAVTKKTMKRAKKAQSFQIGAKAKGKVSYKVTKKDAKKVLTVSKTGKVTIRKNAKAGTYTVKVKATAAAKGIYKKTSKTYTIKVTIKNGKKKTIRFKAK